ncbi:hypothetical protein BDM02DRAFT_2427725 [Thelephora ganbajun]|uniref:Uncharacterized protein n=1 Tax=Thelephora ganbajun TaxID=370292 RepID=A0ACB6ZEP2_THEGA|nr:hypothetical protein BDM02DRAFT_2427725 [Thelephora ganbajun]
MSQVEQHNVTFRSLVSHSAPINKLPTEILIEIFKTYTESYPEVLDQRVVDLCLVRKYWNAVANDTPQLWTRINLSFPFTKRHLAAALKRVHASKLEEIDVSIEFRDPDWDGDEPPYDEDEALHPTNESVWIQDIMTVLRDTEKRWKSIKVVSETWLPLYKIMEGWTFTHLPSLGSISMERENTIFGMRDVPFDPQPLVGPMTLFGHHVSLPKLRDLSLSAVHIDWDDASVGYQNLRKLEIINQTYDVGPSFEQFAAMLASSPRLEYLDVSGFCPEHHTGPAPPAGGAPDIPIVHLPALKEFTFGWKDVELGCLFLQMFQIGSSLETLTLMDTESGFGYWEDPQTRDRGWSQESQGIFETLYELGSAAPGDKDDLPPGPFISMRGVKRLRIVWTKANRSSLVSFLMMLTELEDIWLEDIDRNVLEGVTWIRVGVSLTTVYRPLRGLDFRWTWQEEIPDFAEQSILELKRAGINFSAQAAEEWGAGRGWS